MLILCEVIKVWNGSHIFLTPCIFHGDNYDSIWNINVNIYLFHMTIYLFHIRIYLVHMTIYIFHINIYLFHISIYLPPFQEALTETTVTPSGTSTCGTTCGWPGPTSPRGTGAGSALTPPHRRRATVGTQQSTYIYCWSWSVKSFPCQWRGIEIAITYVLENFQRVIKKMYNCDVPGDLNEVSRETYFINTWSEDTNLLSNLHTKR